VILLQSAATGLFPCGVDPCHFTHLAAPDLNFVSLLRLVNNGEKYVSCTVFGLPMGGTVVFCTRYRRISSAPSGLHFSPGIVADSQLVATLRGLDSRANTGNSTYSFVTGLIATEPFG
jgi:hypothetical protein